MATQPRARASLHRLPAGHGALDACKDCSGRACCGLLRLGGPIEPPYLTGRDIAEIQRVTGLPSGAFTAARNNPVTGSQVLFMLTQEHGGCVFFDDETGRCRVYASRPIDCRLFPLDIRMRDGRYYWVRYRHPHCHLSPHDDEVLLRYGRQALTELADDVEEYATVPVPGMDLVGYDVLCLIEELPRP